MNRPPPNLQSPQSLVLRFMREKRQLTVVFVGEKTGMKPKIIDLLENGRRIITNEEILLFLDCYHFSIGVFNDMLKIKPLTKQAANHYFLTQT
jgi:hypothetical protein